jgi:hypothetical protein
MNIIEMQTLYSLPHFREKATLKEIEETLSFELLEYIKEIL